MYSRTRTMKFTSEFSEQIERLKSVIDKAGCIVIGAGAGLSASAGFEYGGERFRKYFADFEEKYGFHDMYSGVFYPYETLEEQWAFWSRNILANRYTDPPQTRIRRFIGAGKKQGLLCDNNKCRPLLSESGI